VTVYLKDSELKINGEVQSNQLLNKYKDIISDYEDIEFDKGQKFIFKQSDKTGNKKKSVSIKKRI
jgi:hypothetical protein